MTTSDRTFFAVPYELRFCAQRIRIEATRSGRFNPVFKEAPQASQCLFGVL